MNSRNAEADDGEREQMQRSRDDQRRRVAVPMITEIPDDLPEQDAAHRAAESHEAGERADRAALDQIGREDHDDGRPRLLTEERQAEYEDDPTNRLHLWYEHHPRHERGTRAQGNLARPIHRPAAAQQPARERPTTEAAHTRSSVGNPPDASRRFDV